MKKFYNLGARYFANSEDPDKMPKKIAIYQGLHQVDHNIVKSSILQLIFRSVLQDLMVLLYC